MERKNINKKDVAPKTTKNTKAEETKYESKPAKKKSKIKLAIIAITIILAVLLIVLIPKLFNKKESFKDKATYTTSFFIKNKEGKYALYNEDGKQKSKFAFDSTYNFINGSALVYKESDGYAIIDEKGKNIVPYGMYNYVSSYSGLYKVRSDIGYKLLNNKGKTIIEAKDMDVNSYGEDYPFVVVSTDKEVIIYSFDADKILTLKKGDSKDTPKINHVDEIATIFYNGENILFNSRTKKIISRFKNKQHYCVSGYTENKKVYTLNACASWFETVSEKGHKIVIKGQETDLSKDCNNFAVYDNTVLCYKDGGYYFINTSNKKAKLGKKLGSRSAFIDEDNYVIRNEKDYKLDFYKNGKKIKSIEANIASNNKSNNNLYLLYVDSGYEFYNKDGKKAIKESFRYASGFDKNGRARVSKDGKLYYLIDEKGKEKSKKYSNITYYDEYYEVTNKDNKKGIISKDGKVIVPTKYDIIGLRKVRDTYYALASKDSSSYALYNVTNNKLVLETKDKMVINDHYVKTSGNKESYYTLKGKLFYKEK